MKSDSLILIKENSFLQPDFRAARIVYYYIYPIYEIFSADYRTTKKGGTFQGVARCHLRCDFAKEQGLT